jgi:beta-carotene 3-hydroxylase
MFAAVVMLGFAVGFNVSGFDVLVPIGIGTTAYGAAYALVHDVYIHRRLPLFGERTLPVFERLAVAHRRHHDRNGAPYGMLAPLSVRWARGRSGSRPSHDPADA